MRIMLDEIQMDQKVKQGSILMTSLNFLPKKLKECYLSFEVRGKGFTWKKSFVSLLLVNSCYPRLIKP